ncbi:MAG: DUF5916 domain-containing protein [Crocinitomicaceae bacterium]|tara:strand:+ start:8599 stop:11052 length:2454 start_codon:yes stop_codon:yes gene_type:complete
MKLLLTILSIGIANMTFGQKSLTALKTNEAILLNGEFNEVSWEEARWTSQFTQLKPFPGESPSKHTEVALLYDDEALYFGVKCFDNGDSVSKVLSARDDFNPNLDLFAIFLDTYNDKQNGFFFGLTSLGVQLDAKIFNGDFNDLLNLVWNSKTIIKENGWFAEIKIPYSAIRFPKEDIQNWNINFGRQISRYREESTWNPVNPDLENYLLESGKVEGIQGVEPPLRLAFIPFLSSYVNFSKDTETLSSFNGGMDIKYGINEAFTLDVTLLPDFGQVVFDNQVLNISPFEIQFNENRQFFTEGTELFTKSELFYSRRIGVQTPSRVYQSQLNENEYLEEIPNSVPLINASKVSGRLNNGLGIAVFNGITAEQTGKAIDSETNIERNVIISPLSNYNVLVLDQNLKNNSFLTFTNTNVWRSGDFYDANVSGIKAKLNTKNNDYYVTGEGVLSTIIESSESSLGHSWGVETGKQRGNFTFWTEYYEESDTYDPNDLGFLRANNSRVAEVNVGYRNFRPSFWNLNKFQSNLSVNYERLYAPNLFGGAYWQSSLVMVSKSFNAGGLSFNGALFENNDYFEPRAENIGEYKFVRPIWTNMSTWFSSNYQKRIAVDARLGYVDVQRGDWWEWNYSLEFRFRLSNQLFLLHEWKQSFQYNSEGFAVGFGSPINEFDGILFGNRDRLTNEQSLGLDYTITNRLGMTFRLRHYNAQIKYNSFYELLDNGRLNPLADYSGNDVNGFSAYDINYNAFTIDMLLRWVFLPGSELNFVWKNSIFTSDSDVDNRYWETLNNTLQNGPINTISLKVIYWLDSQYLKKKPTEGI